MNPQRIVAAPPKSALTVTHFLLKFTSSKNALIFLREIDKTFGFTFCSGKTPDLAQLHGCELYLGLSYEGLRALDLPAPYLRVFSRLSPSFVQGAGRRAAQLGDTAASAPEHWDSAFAYDDSHAVLSIYGPDTAATSKVADLIFNADSLRQSEESPDANQNADLSADAAENGKRWRCEDIGVYVKSSTREDSPIKRILRESNGEKKDFVHFGYRDGITQTGFSVPGMPGKTRGLARVDYEAGEFLLGHLNGEGSNLWALASASHKVRGFYKDASFGVLRKIEQDVRAFDQAVQAWAISSKLGSLNSAQTSDEWIKAKLCGRFPDGSLFNADGTKSNSTGNAHHGIDPQGTGCPFGAHIRRVSADASGAVHARTRPLIRRGTPYGAYLENPLGRDPSENEPERGLMALFFCASIEEQFEHVLESWIDRLPMGATGDRNGKDPLAGMHENTKAKFEIPMGSGNTIKLDGFEPFVRTRGMIYCFYPGRDGLSLLLQDELIKEDDEEDFG